MDAGSLMRMARAPADTAERMHAVLPSLGLETGGERWPAANLHQSLSTDCPARHEPALRRALGRIRAPAFDLVFNRVGLGDRWVLRARGIPDGFARPLAETRAVLQAEGIACDTGHTPHVTLCYAPPFVQDGTRALASPIAWRVDAVELVVAATHPYRYRTLARQPLAPPPQSELFDAACRNRFSDRQRLQDIPWH